jgi:restriction system protein
MSRHCYEITIRHAELGKFRVIRGTDREIVAASAYAQERIWNEQYGKKLHSEARRTQLRAQKEAVEQNLWRAEELTREAQTRLEELGTLLSQTLAVNDRIDWDKLKKFEPFSQPQPQLRPFLPYPPEPQADELRYQPQLGLIGKFVPFAAQKKQQAAQALFQADHANWQSKVLSIEKSNQSIYERNAYEVEQWNRRATEYEQARDKHNSAIDRRRLEYQALNPEAILDYCDLVLSQSEYPDYFPQTFELDYCEESKTLTVEYHLPSPADLPRVAQVKFVRSRSEFTKTEIPKRQAEQLYEDVVTQIIIRSIHELFEADAVRALDAVIFDGIVQTVNPGTGHTENRCIASIRVSRDSFYKINLKCVQPRACFDSLGGVAAVKLSQLQSIRPMPKEKLGSPFSTSEDITNVRTTALDEWHELVKTLTEAKDVHFIKAGSLAQLIGFQQQEKYSAPLSRELACAVRSRGFAVEPDTAFGGAPYKAMDELALFRPLDGSVTAAYLGASALLQFSVMIAAADDNPTKAELELAREFINKNCVLNGLERQRLHFFEHLLFRNPDLAKRPIGRLTKRLSTEKRQSLAELLLCIAGADGIISSSEWAALARACKMLELPSNALEDILRRLGATFDDPTVQEAVPDTAAEPLPPTQTINSSPKTPAFVLDMNRVAAISNETAQVIGLLSQVMREDDAESGDREILPFDSATGFTRKEPTGNTLWWLMSLDDTYKPIATRIVSKPVWNRADFQQLAAEFNLMPLGIYDTLNEWADEELGDFLLKGEDPVVVNVSIIPKEPRYGGN